MHFNLDCDVAFRRLSSKSSYLGCLLVLVISCFIYFFCFIEQTSVFYQKRQLHTSINSTSSITTGQFIHPNKYKIPTRKENGSINDERNPAIKNPYPGVENYTRYVVARFGLSPFTNVEQLKPEFGPVINDVHSIRYPLTIPSCANATAAGKQSVFVAVISAPDNFDKRKMIRQTWKNHLKAESEKGGLTIAGFGFILGRHETNNLTQAKIEEESNLYEDIIQIEMLDFYRNLSLKVIGLINWLHRNCYTFDFLLKVDDDVYVNVRYLAHLVESHYESKNPVILGDEPTSFTPNREGKWKISFKLWPWDRFPYYYTGGAVMISGNAIIPLLAACQTTPMLPFDDVYLLGLCTEKAGIKIFSSVSFLRIFPVGCEFLRVLAWLTDDQVISHLATVNFYRSSAHQCAFTENSG